MGATPKLDIDAATWAALNRLLDTALELPPNQRAGWVDRLGPEYDALKSRLRDLLSRSGQSGALIRTLGSFPLGALEEHGNETVLCESPGDIVGPYRLLRSWAQAAWAQSGLPCAPTA